MKKLFTLFALFMAIVTGAQASETFSMASKWGNQPFTKTQNGITVTFSENTNSSTQNGYIKFVKGQTMTISSTVGNITALSFTSDSDKYGKADGTTVNTGTITGAGTANISWAGDASEIIITNDESKGGDWRVASIIVTYSSAPATKPTITTQPQNATYVINSEDYPSMSVEATASAGDLKYQWHIILPTTGDFTIPGANAATLSLATYATQMAAYLSQEGAYSIYCNVADDNDNVDSDMATLTVTATAPVTPNDPTFDKADGASMKAGDIITVTSSEGSTIYYRWSGKSGQTWSPEAFKEGRTGYDSPCTTTTSTKGDRYVYAMAEINGNYSNITSIKVTVSENPVKGQLDKTSDAVDQNAEAPAVPVFTLVDADGNPSPASMGAEGSTKDIFVKYVVTGTEGIINLNSDATAIESISTATAGTATATITITQNKDAYPIIDGEGTYTYTITVSEGSGPTPPAASYSESVNIEQLVLDYGVKYDIAKEFVDNYIEYASLNALDSLNDADGKFQRNEPFLGLKLKTAGAYIKVTLKQGSTLKVKLGNIGDNVKVNINGTEQEDIVKMTTKDASYMTTVYEYTADDADAVVTFTTSSTGTVVFKQIMIDEEIAQVILPYAVDMPTAAANGSVDMPASANPGDEVTIVATPDEGYELDAITVTGKSTNNAYEVNADNKFTMPEENVNVTVTFKQITGINNVNANDNANSDANVKVIKNGKLYIGNYNIAGQQVK